MRFAAVSTASPDRTRQPGRRERVGQRSPRSGRRDQDRQDPERLRFEDAPGIDWPFRQPGRAMKVAAGISVAERTSLQVIERSQSCKTCLKASMTTVATPPEAATLWLPTGA